MEKFIDPLNLDFETFGREAVTGWSKWTRIRSRFKRGRRKTITRDEILELLDAGHAIPPELNAMFAKILRNEFSFKYADKVQLPGYFSDECIEDMVHQVEAIIKSQKPLVDMLGEDCCPQVKRRHSNYRKLARTTDRTRRITALESAKAEVGLMFGVSDSAIDQACRRARAFRKKLAER